MKKIPDNLKSDIKILHLGELPLFKENKSDFDQFKEALKRKHNISDKTINRELRKLDEDDSVE
ncbi:MAG: hypothetical protein ACHQJ4_07180 [Ignavibacteria bacterium]